MSDCGLVTGPASSGLIQNQLAAVTAKGDAAFAMAINAIESLKTVFSAGAIDRAISWRPAPFVASTTDTNLVFAKPLPVPLAPDDTFNMPQEPDNVLVGLDKIDDVLNDILNELKQLINTMPQFSGLTIDDRYLTILAEQYTRMTTQINAILAACPATSALCVTLSAWMQDAAVGMPIAVEEALRDRAFGAEDRKASQAKSEAMSDWLARGFSLPSGALEVKLARIELLAADQKRELNRDIFIESAKWERETRQFAIEKTLQYEGMQRDFFIKVTDLARTVAGEWQGNHIKVQLAKVDVYKAQMEAFAAAADALQSMGVAAAALIKAKIDEQNGLIALFEAKLKGRLGELEAKTSIFNSQVALYKTEGDTEKNRVDAALAEEGIAVQRERIKSDIDIKSQELEMTQMIEVGKVTAQSYSDIARTAATLAAGWTSALSMSASISNSSSFGNSSECQVSYSYRPDS